VFPLSAKKVLVRQKEKGKTVHEEKEKVEESEEIPHGMCSMSTGWVRQGGLRFRLSRSPRQLKDRVAIAG
jgi:hypothetical protein